MLYVHQSNRLERLADALAGVLEEPLPCPQMPEWVGVQTEGVGIWLSMQIASRLGVWCNVQTPYPRAMIEKLFQAVLGPKCPDTAVFGPDRLTWSVMALLPGLLDHRAFGPLKAYLGADPRGIKCFQLAERIADTFDRYAVYRPEMVLAWEAQRNDDWADLPPEHRWQPVLWRALVARLGASHVAAAAGRCLAALEGMDACPGGLPPRISLFGVSTLPPLYVHVLAGLPDCVQVHLFLLSPSRGHWAYIRSRRDIVRQMAQRGAGDCAMEEALHLEEGNRLLASLGKLGRDFQGVLEAAADYAEPSEDLYAEAGTRPVLHRLQDDILNLRLRAPGLPDAPQEIDEDDDSLQVHVCHGCMREVQVLRDRLMDMFQKDPGLAPHDVIVMMPDIDTYAPLVEAVFGAGSASEPSLPYTVSDRGPAAESLVIQAFLELLRLADSRLPVQEVVDFLALEPVRRRFGLGAEEVPLVRDWLVAAGVRWGRDAAHRAAFGQPARHENTWRFGLERLLLGMAMPDVDRVLFAGVLPCPNAEGGTAQVLGRAVTFCETLFDVLAALPRAAGAERWRQLLSDALSRLVAADGENDYQHHMVHAALDTLAAAAGGVSQGVPLAVVTPWLTAQFKRRPGVRGFLSGGITFCNLMPMRSIPFPVVCLLGMNDDAFPRSRPPYGFDLMAAHGRAGDRSVRNDDRYLFLEALLSARARLLIFYVGRAVSDNALLPPSVVVGELLDTLDEGFYLAGDGHQRLRASDRLVIEHPLQPFHPTYFNGADRRLFSFSTRLLAGAAALTGAPETAPAFVSAPFPKAGEETVVSVEALVRFFEMPAAFFLKQCLGVVFDPLPAPVDAREPLGLEGLVRYGAGEFLLSRKLDGNPAPRVQAVLKGEGILPLGTPGKCALAELDQMTDGIAEIGAGQEAGGVCLPPVSLDLRLGGVRVVGVIDRLTPTGRVVYTYGLLHPRRKLALWIVHLLLGCLPDAPCPVRSLLVGRGQKGPNTCGFATVADAPALVAELLALYSRGMRIPLPFFPAAAYAYVRKRQADAAGQDREAMAAAWNQFTRGAGGARAEGEHPAVVRVFGTGNALEDAPGGGPGFRELALRVFTPLVRAEGEPAKEASP